MMKSSYAKLFKVELLHEYFSNRQCPDFEIFPSEDTKVLLNRAKISWRNTGNKLITFIEQNEAGEPRFNTTSVKHYRNDFGNSVFRFYLRLRNPVFFNYTNIDFDFNSQKKFYFNNLSRNSGSGYLFLSVPLSPFVLQKQYTPGDIVKDTGNGKVYEALKRYTSKRKTELSDPLLWSPKGMSSINNNITDLTIGKSYNPGDLVKEPKTENVFEAIKKFTANSQAELSDRSLWAQRGQGQMQYANGNDLIECSSGNYNFTVSNPVTKADISVFAFNYNPASPGYDVPIRDNEIKNFNQPGSIVPVNLSSVKQGKYLIKINGEAKEIYYDPAMNAGNVFGVIEIFNFLPANNEYSLLTEDEKIKEIDYQISFATRSVLWKYIRKDGKAQTVTDSGSTAYQFTLQGDGFVSSSPIPLSENALKTLALEFNTTDFKLSPLPNPSPERFGKCNQNDYDYLCSEIYLNY